MSSSQILRGISGALLVPVAMWSAWAIAVHFSQFRPPVGLAWVVLGLSALAGSLALSAVFQWSSQRRALLAILYTPVATGLLWVYAIFFACLAFRDCP